MKPPSILTPGVYVLEETGSSSAIAGVSTSITAFVGRTERGPIDAPVLISGFSDFETLFGGLWAKSPLSYSVKQFFDNGGSQAYIVRICATQAELAAVGIAEGAPPPVTPPVIDPRTGKPAELADGRARLNVAGSEADQALSVTTPLTPPAGAFQLSAADPGAWGDRLRVALDREGIDVALEAKLGVPAGSLVNLTAYLDGQTERAQASLSEDAGEHRLDRVLEGSRWLRAGSDPESVAWADALTEGADPSATPLAAIVRLHDGYRKQAGSEAALLAMLPAGQGGDDGRQLLDARLFTGDPAGRRGLYRLDSVEIFNLLVIPRDSLDGPDLELDCPPIFHYVVSRRAFWILEVPRGALPSWDAKILRGEPGIGSLIPTQFQNPGELGRSAAVYYPDLLLPDPLNGMASTQFGPAGAVAGVYARTDVGRGVWKAPAGSEATVVGAVGLSAALNDAQNGAANEVGINCIRVFPRLGATVWGARTLQGATALGDELKYVPVRRLLLYLESSLDLGLRWAVFEPNNEALWSRIRADAGVFLNGLFRQGALMGASAKDAYFVRCDRTTMTQDDLDRGICVVTIGVAPLRPAEFVILSLRQMTADAAG